MAVSAAIDGDTLVYTIRTRSLDHIKYLEMHSGLQNDDGFFNAQSISIRAGTTTYLGDPTFYPYAKFRLTDTKGNNGYFSDSVGPLASEFRETSAEAQTLDGVTNQLQAQRYRIAKAAATGPTGFVPHLMAANDQYVYLHGTGTIKYLDHTQANQTLTGLVTPNGVADMTTDSLGNLFVAQSNQEGASLVSKIVTYTNNEAVATFNSQGSEVSLVVSYLENVRSIYALWGGANLFYYDTSDAAVWPQITMDKYGDIFPAITSLAATNLDGRTYLVGAFDASIGFGILDAATGRVVNAASTAVLGTTAGTIRAPKSLVMNDSRTTIFINQANTKITKMPRLMKTEFRVVVE